MYLSHQPTLAVVDSWRSCRRGVTRAAPPFPLLPNSSRLNLVTCSVFLQHFSASILQYCNIWILQFHSTPLLQYFNVPFFGPLGDLFPQYFKPHLPELFELQYKAYLKFAVDEDEDIFIWAVRLSNLSWLSDLSLDCQVISLTTKPNE